MQTVAYNFRENQNFVYRALERSVNGLLDRREHRDWHASERARLSERRKCGLSTNAPRGKARVVKPAASSDTLPNGIFNISYSESSTVYIIRLQKRILQRCLGSKTNSILVCECFPLTALFVGEVIEVLLYCLKDWAVSINKSTDNFEYGPSLIECNGGKYCISSLSNLRSTFS